jgi:preprotein translocase subunit SecE
METIKKWFQSISVFFGEVKGEVLKVSYPTKDEVIGSTTVVLVLTLVVTIFLATIDSILVRLLRWVF